MYLGYGHTSTTDKVFAFLWCCFLEACRDVSLLRFRLGRIRSLTTDWGIESAMCDAKDLLPCFLAGVGIIVPPYQRPVQTLDWLFPRALWCPGWHNIWDGVIKDTLQK